MKVLIVNTNQCTQPMPVMPYGACVVAQAAETAGHEVQLLDLMFKKDPVGALQSSVRTFQPHVVGLSVRNIDNNDMRNTAALYRPVSLLVNTVRSHGEATVVIGGPAVGVMPEPLLRNTRADYAVIGDGEAIFPELLWQMERGGDPDQTPGVAYVEDGRYVRRPAEPRPLGGECLFPDFTRWLEAGRYQAQMASAPLQTKRGCPHECVYCTYNLAEGREHRLQSPEAVADGVEKLVQAGMRDVEFVDNVFNSPYEHAMAVCRELARRRTKARIMSLELNPRFVTDELLLAMEAAGFVGIGITAESAATPVLAGLNKGYTSEAVYRAAEIVGRHRLPCVWIFMLGGPGETPETVGQTLAFARQGIRRRDMAFFTVGIRIYPGTALEGLARRQGLLQAKAEDMLEPKFYLSPQTPYGWLVNELKQAARENLNFVTGDAIALPLLQKVLAVSRRLGVHPPVWRHTRTIRRVLRTFGLYQ